MKYNEIFIGFVFCFFFPGIIYEGIFWSQILRFFAFTFTFLSHYALNLVFEQN